MTDGKGQVDIPTAVSSRLRESLGILDAAEREIRGVANEEGDDEDDVVRPEYKLEVPDRKTSVDVASEDDLITDYCFARNLTYALIDLMGGALAGAIAVAKDSEHPRAYGVANELAATMRDLTKDLLGMQKVFKEIVARERVATTPTPTTLEPGADPSGTPTIESASDISAILDLMQRAKAEQAAKEAMEAADEAKKG